LNIDRLCNDVADAVERIRIAFRSNIDIPELLDRVWCLQDQVSRLVESAFDQRQETFDVLREKHPGLIQDIMDLLGLTEKLHFADPSAIRAASRSINRSLGKLEQLREQANVTAANA
jgi:hypothetical protein